MNKNHGDVSGSLELGLNSGGAGSFLAARWRRVCLVRWSLRMKRLWHRGQAKRFSPVWVRRWRDSSSERAKRRSHPSQLQRKGFSPARGQTFR
ncbi:hypothetical protein JZ751_023764 [Albula glossodonta]|uniref:Uncharacterized protein n=1 Tax=Albula glossodonta TaxID=121402 RepID=A0A8T2NK50_9TELE|nr:hypothetical protein JZ751_023764 [Albula glossodonta]